MGNRGSKLTVEQLSELQKSTLFDRKEIQQWHRSFSQDCSTGYLSREEFLYMFKQFFPFGDPTRFAEHVFAVLDRDESGSINYSDFLYSLSVMSRGRLSEKLEMIFQLYDLDRDGYISKSEMYKIVEAIYRLAGETVDYPQEVNTPAKRVDIIFSAMDVDRDGKLSWTEFRDGVQRDSSIISCLSFYDGLV